MALTVATTTVDTSWAELGIVQYTASTIGTLSALIDEVGLRLNRGSITSSSIPTDAQIAQWLVRGKQEFARTKMYTWRRRYVTGTTTAGTYRYSMPPDFDGGPLTIRDLTNDRKIPVVSNSRFDDMVVDPSEETTDYPSIATVKNMELWLAPCGEGITIELEYLRSGDDITTTDFSWIPEPEKWSIVDYAAGEAFEYLHDFEKAGWYRQKYGGGVAMARKSDSKRKWATSEKRGRNIFQAR
jgi:hypothetical protein